ncbi:MAG: tRNA (adenosine(37)-N6)-dimethylallyltransferase MiaA [Bacillota bacterium]|nr:tRNA (adenosine(37)-N6)-dimethylallyltransferase MiaA [Bacillota bacterium]
MKDKVLVVAGPTAAGKTEYAIALARHFGGEIVSADSMQIYRYMDIGSAKPTREEQASVPHHLIDAVDPRVPWSVAEYQQAARAAIRQILSRGKLPLVAGGTGLYVNSIIYDMDFSATPKQEGLRQALERQAAEQGPESLHRRLAALDPAAAERIHPNNVKKLVRAIEVLETGGRGIPEFQRSFVATEEYQCLLLGLTRNREELYRRIDSRAELLFRAGLAKEVEGLMAMGLTEESVSMQGIGYKEMAGALKGLYSMEEALELIQRRSRNYAKRQLTWFRRIPGMVWFNLSDYASGKDALSAMIHWAEEAL